MMISTLFGGMVQAFRSDPEWSWAMLASGIKNLLKRPNKTNLYWTIAGMN